MPVVEELVAELGFKITGTKELQKFDKFLLDTKKGMSDFATVVSKKLNTAGFKTGTTIGKMIIALRSGVSHLAVMSASVAAFGIRLAWAASKAGTLVFAIAQLARAYANARREAALLRNAAQLDAKGKGTRVANIDKIGRGFLALGLRPEEAGEFIGEIAEKARDARLDPEKDKVFGPNKVRVGTKTGKPIDPAAIAVDTIGAWFRLRKQADTAKGTTKQVEANRALEQFQKDAGFSDKLVGALAGVASFAEFMRRTRFFNDANPTERAADTAREDAIGARWIAVSNDFEGALGGVTRALDRFGMTIQEQVLPVFEAFAGGLNGFARRVGLIDETVGGREQEAEADREFRRGVARMTHTEPPELAAARRVAAEHPGSDGWMTWLFGTPQEKAIGRLDSARQRYEDMRGLQLKMVGKEAGPTQEKLAPVVAGALADMVAKLEAIDAMIHPMNVPLPQPRPNIENSGNDNRQFHINTSVPVTVVPGVGAIGPAAAAGVDQKILGAVTTKSTNTSTDALTAP